MHGFKNQNLFLPVQERISHSPKLCLVKLRVDIQWRHRSQCLHAVAQIALCATVDVIEAQALGIKKVNLIQALLKNGGKPRVMAIDLLEFGVIADHLGDVCVCNE